MTPGNTPKYYKSQLAPASVICITGLLQIIFIDEYRRIGLYWLLLPGLAWLADSPYEIYRPYPPVQCWPCSHIGRTVEEAQTNPAAGGFLVLGDWVAVKISPRTQG